MVGRNVEEKGIKQMFDDDSNETYKILIREKMDSH